MSDADVTYIQGPAVRIQFSEDPRDVAYQVTGMGPGVQFEWRWLLDEHVGWYAYEHPDSEDCQGPLTEAEALDWLWNNPPVCSGREVRKYSP